MAAFVGHEPCPSCGSRDNLGRYDDGSAFCFGCKYHERAKHAPPRSIKKEEDDSSTPQLPDDTDTNFSEEAVRWMAQYHLSVEEALRQGIRWSNSKQQLIFLLEDGCWQARNFHEGTARRRKYFTAGNVNDSIKIYLPRGGASQHRQLSVVEDCVSAIRIAGSQSDAAACCDAMPVLGSHVSRQKLSRLARLYDKLIIWLDHDKLKEARGLSTAAQMLGLETKVIYTEDDPKCFTDEQLKEYIND